MNYFPSVEHERYKSCVALFPTARCQYSNCPFEPSFLLQSWLDPGLWVQLCLGWSACKCKRLAPLNQQAGQLSCRPGTERCPQLPSCAGSLIARQPAGIVRLSLGGLSQCRRQLLVRTCLSMCCELQGSSCPPESTALPHAAARLCPGCTAAPAGAPAQSPGCAAAQS